MLTPGCAGRADRGQKCRPGGRPGEGRGAGNSEPPRRPAPADPSEGRAAGSVRALREPSATTGMRAYGSRPQPLSGTSSAADIRQHVVSDAPYAAAMSSRFTGIIDRYLLSGSEFTRRLRAVRPEQWTAPTPCAEWNVRQLVNHMTRGNLNYVSLLDGGSAADFLRLRDEDALGSDPVGACTRSVRECAEAFRRPGALKQLLDYPLGPVTGEQALAVRTTDATIHAWDLARAIGAPEELDAGPRRLDRRQPRRDLRRIGGIACLRRHHPPLLCRSTGGARPRPRRPVRPACCG